MFGFLSFGGFEGVAAATAASRILFAISRDGFGENRLGRASTRSGAPAGAPAVILGVAVLAMVGCRINGTGAVNAFFRGERKVPAWEIVVPLIALAIILYVLDQNTLAGSLEYPHTVFPLVVAGWLVLGLLIIFLVPGSPSASARA